MKENRTKLISYSSAFKRKVVSEVERGEYSISDAQKLYGINGNHTISDWLKKIGKNHLVHKVVHIEMAQEHKSINELKQAKQELESALANAQLKILRLESTIKAADEFYKVDLKKSFDKKA